MTLSDPATAIVTAVLVVLVIAAIVIAIIGARRRSDRLQAQYGTEYERTLRSAGNRKAAEEELLAREQRHKTMDIKPLPGGLREGYAAQWKLVQARFVDEPRNAVWDASKLLHKVMESRGYPVRDLIGQAEDLSVDYGPLVANYRTANAIALASKDGATSIDQMRDAFLLFRSMFDALLETSDAQSQRVG